VTKNSGSIKRRFWFMIDTYVHISLKRDVLLLYNTLTGKALEYSGEEKIFRLVKKLRSKVNLQVIPLTEKDLEDPVILRFVSDIRKYFMGDLIDTSFSKGKPVQAAPILTLRKDVTQLKKKEIRSAGEDMMTYLAELSLYLNNQCHKTCGICAEGYKQFLCCTVTNSKKGELDITAIERLLPELKSCRLVKLNILGGDIFRYSKFERLLSAINPLKAIKTYYSHYSNTVKGRGRLKLLDPDSSLLNILVPFPVNREELEAALEIVKNMTLNSKFIFIIRGIGEFEKAQSLISSLEIDDYDFKPFYNGENLDFFKENIFTGREEIIAEKPRLRDIYTNSKLNHLDFGRLTVLSNRHIYANVNASRLGILGKDSIYDVLYKEMYYGKSWRRVRKHLEPCKRCTYESLCPPVSNYSRAIGRNDLCHI
jgi:pseudo-rSAM protein